MKKRVFSACCLVCGLLFLMGGQVRAEPLPVYVSILPQKYVVERIGGDRVDVSVMVRAGASPATYDPTPRQMAGLSRARAYFAIGVPFEAAWLKRISAVNPEMAMQHMDKGIAKLPMAAHHHHDDEAHGDAHDYDEDHGDAHHYDEDHGDAHHHDDAHADAHHDGEAHEEAHQEAHHHDEDHGDAAHHHDEAHEKAQHGHEDDHGLDPHVWLAPDMMRVLARNAAQGLKRLDPDRAEEYERNLRDFLDSIDRLDADIRAVLAPIPADHRVFMVFHPSWGYFAAQYNLTQVPIEAEGKEPGPGELADLIREGRELGVSAVFVQPQFSQKSASVIASELGARVVRVDPLAEDWDDNLRRAARAFAEALSKDSHRHE